MVDRKKAPFAPDEKQQEALNELKKFARDWAVAASAQKELVKENPELTPKELQTLLFPPDKSLPIEFAKVQKLGIPSDVMYNAYNQGSQISPDKLRPEIDELKASKAAAIDELKMSKPSHLPLNTGSKASPTGEVKMLSDEEKAAVLEKIREYVQTREIRDAVAYGLMKDDSISERNQDKVKEYKDAAPIEFNAKNPLKNFDSNTLKANGLIEAFNTITRETRQEIKEGKHDQRISEETGRLKATFTSRVKEIEVTGGDFNLPDDVKEHSLKVAQNLLNKFDSLKDFGADIHQSDIGKMAKSITPDGSITAESVAAVLLATTIKAKGPDNKEFISSINDETHLLLVKDKDKPLILEMAKKILADTYHKEVVPTVNTEAPSIKEETKANPAHEAAIKQIQAYTREYEIRYAAVTKFTKDHPELQKENPNKVMEFMAIPNPLEAFNRDTKQANDLKNAAYQEATKTKEEIAHGKHDKTIEEMEKKILDSFSAQPKKSTMDFYLPDAAKESVHKAALNLQESNVAMTTGNSINSGAAVPRKPSSLML